MGWNRTFVGVGVAMAVVVAGCSSSHEGSEGDAGPVFYDSWIIDTGGGEACGSTICGPGTSCCNASCGICTPPGVGCIAIACEDAGPGPHACGGLGGASCGASEYCDYPDGSYCGGDDSTGICRPRPTGCPDPGGTPVCGCNGVDYLADCSAYMSGTDIAHAGRCTPPPTTRGVSAQRSCGPTDGPAWTFTVTDGAPVCSTIPSGASLSVTVWDGLEGVAAGTSFSIGGDFTAGQGQGSYCPAGGGGPPCFTLTGTMTFDHFISSESASFSYDLYAFDGSHYTGTAVTVASWCPSAPLCG